MAKKGSNFSAFSKKLKNGEDALNKGRKGRKGFIEVEAGSYAARFQSLEFGANDKVPFSKLTSVVVESENEDDVGLKIAEFISFAEKSGTKNGKKWKITEEDNFANLCSSLQSFGIDTSELELGELEEVAEALAEDQPACNVTVVEKGGYTKVRWGKYIEDDELPSLEDALDDEEDEEYEDSDDEEEDDDDGDDDSDAGEEESDDDDESDDEDEDDAEDEEYEDEEDDGDEDEDEPVVRGTTVTAKPGRAKKSSKYKVKSSNKSKQTCTLIRISDKREFKDQPWSCVE